MRAAWSRRSAMDGTSRRCPASRRSFAGCTRREEEGFRKGCEAPSESEPCDLDAGVLQLVAAIDRGEHRRDSLERSRVGERAGVQGAQPERGAELGHHLLRRGVAPAEQEIAFDRMIAVLELVGG